MQGFQQVVTACFVIALPIACAIAYKMRRPMPEEVYERCETMGDRPEIK